MSDSPDDIEGSKDRPVVVVGVAEQLGAEDGDGGDAAPGEEEAPLPLQEQQVHGYRQAQQGGEGPACRQKSE